MKQKPVFITKGGKRIPMNVGHFHFSTGTSVSDMNRKENGDFKQIAWLPNTGKLRLEEKLDPHYIRSLKRKHDDLKNRVKGNTEHLSASQFGTKSKRYKQSMNPKSPHAHWSARKVN